MYLQKLLFQCYSKLHPTLETLKENGLGLPRQLPTCCSARKLIASSLSCTRTWCLERVRKIRGHDSYKKKDNGVFKPKI